MKDYIHLDFESSSTQSLNKDTSVGLDNYWRHPNTKVLMLAYAFGEHPVELWQPHEEEMPSDLKDALLDPDRPLAAWNSSFERYALKYKLQIDTPIERWYDPQASARYLSLPGALDKVGEILALRSEFQKDKRGENLIKLFSEPQLTRKKKGEEQKEYFNDWNTHPEEWKLFCEYCKQDVRAEREIMRLETLLKVFPLPPLERRIWIFDQKVNDRGMPVDVDFVKKMYALGVRSKQEAVEKQNKLTGLANSNSRNQMLAWAKGEGYEPNTLRKETVESWLKYHAEKLTPVCIEALQARRAASSITYTKLSAILRQVSADNRLRQQFIYMGSARCGRWSGNAVQLQNMARPGILNGHNFEDESVIDEARSMVDRMDYDGIKEKYGSVLLTIKNLIRTVFVAPEGRRLNVADLNAIETRGAAWISGCEPLLKVFEPRPGKPNGNDPYIEFSAVKLMGTTYEKLEADLKSSDKMIKKEAKDNRGKGKIGVLSCVYRTGGGGWGKNKYGDDIKTGLWGQAEGYGIQITQEQSHQIVRVFRESYLEIPQCWFDIESAYTDVLAGVRTKREIGPNGCIKFDKISFKNPDGTVRIILRIQLPSGRFLHYMDASIQDLKKPWKDQDGNDVYGPTLTYSGVNQTNKAWSNSITSHGGKVFENIDQGFSRDIIAVKMIQIEEIGIEIDGHAHDEGIGETPDCPFQPDHEDMIEIMSQPVNWAPNLPLGADGFSSSYYHK
jgi:DNA polymerase